MSNEAHEYNVKVSWIHGRTGKFIIEGKPEITIASPPEFGGPEGIVSPEDLFVGAATSCLMTTFVTFTGKMRFDFKSFTCEGKGT
ncbi:MAG: OsmC family protein, partial [Promethearchaeota archaeon]